MPDNEGTANLLDYLTNDAALHVDFVVYWKPSARQQWGRLTRKVRAAGIRAAVRRVAYALEQQRPADGREPRYREYFVPGHNSAECHEVLQRERVDVLILSTNAIIGSHTLRIPRLVTLNAHPGWIPEFRGLGANLFQMKRGRLPAVSVHAVDEGVDTGALIARRKVEVDARWGLPTIEEEVERHRHELLAEVVRSIQRGELRYVDTFDEPSNMTRGMSARRRKRLDARLKSGRLELS